MAATSLGSATAPSLVGRRVALEPVRMEDLPLLYDLELSAEVGFRWRFRGATPSPEQHARSLWDGVLATFLVRSLETGSPVALLTAHHPSVGNEHARLSAATFPSYHHSGLAIEGAALFVDYCFACWRLRKLYVDTIEFNLPQFASVTRDLFVEEGRLRDAEYYGGRLWDRVILGLDRDRWEQRRAEILRWCLPIGTAR